MAKIKAVQHTSHSEQIIIDANQEFDVFDSRGRKFTLKRPSYLKEMQFIEAMGQQAKDIDEYRMNAVFLSYVSKIDGIPVPKVNTKQTLEALMERVDREGILCIVGGVKDNFLPDNLFSEEEQKQEIKK
jgi:hypothetical protein